MHSITQSQPLSNPLVEPVTIAPYNPKWAQRFQQFHSLLADALGNEVLAIEHIGSTAVKGLAAKDRIDIQISVETLCKDTRSKLDHRLLEAGFQRTAAYSDHLPPWQLSKNGNWDKWYVAGGHPSITESANIHIRRYGSPNHRYALLFRDFLRDNPIVAQTYAEAKQRLASVHRNERDVYCKLKDPVCDLIMLQAEGWAERTSWKVAPL